MPRSLVTRLGLALASVALGGLLILNFRTPDDVVDAGSGSGSSTGPGSGTSGSGTSGTGSGSSTTGGTTPTPAPTSKGSSSGGTSSGTKTVTGDLIQTRYGPVQVQLTVTNGKITAASAVALPSGGRSGMISAYAEPILDSETLTAQSAQIDLVSGATYTSDAYDQSLQAALDQAGL